MNADLQAIRMWQILARIKYCGLDHHQECHFSASFMRKTNRKYSREDSMAEFKVAVIITCEKSMLTAFFYVPLQDCLCEGEHVSVLAR